MNANFLKIVLILLLVCTLLFDVNARKGGKKSKNKHVRAKKKSKMETTIKTPSATTVEQELLLKGGLVTTDKSVASKFVTAALKETKRPKKKKSEKRNKKKRKGKPFDAPQRPLMKLLDLLFQKAEDSNDLDETTSLNVADVGVTTPAVSLSDIFLENHRVTEIRLSEEETKVDPNRAIAKQTMYAEEVKKDKITLEVVFGDAQMTTPTTLTQMEQVTSVPSLPNVESNKLPAMKNLQVVGTDECTSRAVEAKFQDLVDRQKVPKDKIVSWKNAQTVAEKIAILNQTLVDLRYPSLPSCNGIESMSTTDTNEMMIVPPILNVRNGSKLDENDKGHEDDIPNNDNNTNDNKKETEKMIDECDIEVIKSKMNEDGKADLPSLLSCQNKTNQMQNLNRMPKENWIETTIPVTRKTDQLIVELKLDTTTAQHDTTEKPKDDCNLGLNITNLEQVFEIVRKMEEKEMVPTGTTEKAVNGKISLMQLKEMVLKAAIAAGKIPPTCLDRNSSQGRPPKLGASISRKQRQQLTQVTAMMKAGYLPPDTLEKFARGEITREWLKANMSKNRDFILSMLPEPISSLIKEGKMPLEIEAAIFSGSHNKTEIGKMMVQDDKLIKSLLPQKILDMLQDRPVPMDLKILIVSGKNASEIEDEIRANDTILQQMMSPSMFFFYELFQNPVNVILNIAISVTVVVVLAFVMVSLGCTMTVTKIAEHAKKPKGVIIALFAQFVIMPASAFGLTQLFDLELYAAMAVLICGCCPGGNLSNMLAYSMSGDMNLSILMTTCSSILGLGFMPLSIYLYSQFIIPVDSGAIVPFDKIIINIALTIIPVGIGILIRHFRPQWVTNVMRVGGAVLIVCTITVAVLAGLMLGDAFFVFFPLPVLACCAILPMTGYIFGYIFAWIAGENPKCRRTICVETGCQNVQLCGTVLKLAFNPILVGVLFLMPLVYMLFQVVEAFLIIFIFRLYNRLRGHKELVEEDSEVKKKTDLESGDEDKKGDKQEENKALLNEDSNSSASKSTDNKTKKNDGDDSDLAEIWPLEGKPTTAYLDSFKTAGNENFV